MAQLEVAIIADGSAQMWTCSAWDVASGTALRRYRAGASGAPAPGCVSLVGQDYLAVALKNKPALEVWPLNSQQARQSPKLILPGRAGAMCFSPDGAYCVLAVEEKLYVWQVVSGALLAVVAAHYQKINRIRFCDDGSHFAVAADDGAVTVWSLRSLTVHPGGELTFQDVAGRRDPVHSFSDHSLPVTDIAIGAGGVRTRLVSVSIDRSCKMYDLSSGERLLNLVFPESLSCVAMNSIETDVFVGSTEGNVYRFSIANPPRVREYFLNEKDTSQKFSGHSKAVTCLSLSIDGETLLSGSADGKAIVWHVPGRQKINVIPHNGPVTDAFFTLTPKGMFTDRFEPTLNFQAFKRNVDHDCDVEIVTKTSECDFWEIEDRSDRSGGDSNSSKMSGSGGEAEAEIQKLRKINNELYRFALEELLGKNEIASGT